MRAAALPTAPTVAPLIRIRTVLLALALFFGVSWTLPRMRAALTLYTAATAFAHYALCMVGPTGPSLLRDNPSEFWRLARRKLVSAPPEDHPFKKCEKAALVVSDSPAAQKVHQAAAMTFSEWGADRDGAPTFTLADLGIGTRHLAELSDKAWPFVRDGYTGLVKPSSYAAEASHPVEPPRPIVVRGVAPVRSLSLCTSASGVAEFSLDLSSDRRFKVARSTAGGGSPVEVRFAPAAVRIFALACDETKAVIGVGREGSRDVELLVCALGGGCDRMPLPRLSSDGAVPRFPLDVARVEGTTVIATTMRGIVRVASTRDDGVSWTPLTVVFDPGEHGAGDGAARLVTTARRVFVHGSASRGSYWVLASDDAGASWRAP